MSIITIPIKPNNGATMKVHMFGNIVRIPICHFSMPKSSKNIGM